MKPKPQRMEVGIVWKQEQQLIRMTLERLVENGSLNKLSIIADEIGMTEDEFRSKVSMNPRTPMTWAERVAIENEIFKRDANEFAFYLQQYHLSNHITVRVGADLKRVAE